MLQGLRSVIYPVGDLEVGKAWYARVLGFAPYFDQVYYVGFAVGGFELGLIPDGDPGPAGGLAYWGVPDLDRELARRAEECGTARVIASPATDVGGGIRVAAVLDPWGNQLGLIENPAFDPTLVR